MKKFVPTAGKLVWLAKQNRKLRETIGWQKRIVELQDEQIELLKQIAFGKIPEDYKQALEKQREKTKSQPFKVVRHSRDGGPE